MAIVVALSGNTEFFVLLYGVIAHLLKVKLILLVVFKFKLYFLSCSSTRSFKLIITKFADYLLLSLNFLFVGHNLTYLII